ncbi:3-hydroxyisobutyrate dehydrogenase [Pseudovibrio exalbescens]|uniref:3-hydroxyisobutyrate dehydrogenase n=1 Tax=Pseudovibrio exalbescens TaxID=197461 RepID=A0A1U7JG00_9HYPH|nr:3-hydroxyisobutyrate dehydrogenase [Pseudovibrio exalbescens]OKL43659.1 3-hydroxyisobutyrate dehydrogenase [Pseudovibrio exalbescens]
MSDNSLRIAFVGLGNMGGPMAINLVKAGHEVYGVDLSETALQRHKEAGGKCAESIPEAVKDADVVITMLPAGKHVRAVYTGDEGVLTHAERGTLLIDSSTIDVDTARDVAGEAVASGMHIVDAPVSGGAVGAQAGTLTFMVGGPAEAVERARPLLDVMGKSVVHAGDAGAGQAAKICNNMLLAISMIGTCEAFVLAEKLGLDAAKLFEVASTSSGQCWSLTSYCPVPGPVPTSPANNDYKPGFAAEMMLKDLGLARQAAESFGAATPMGHRAAELYEQFCNQDAEKRDFSAIIHFLRQTG